MKTFLILVLLATATPAVAQTSPTTAISPLGPGSALLSLSAEGRSRRTPDLANFSAGVVTQGRNAAEAMAANSRQMDSVIAVLRRAGIAERDIQTSAISLQPRYNNPEREAQMRGRMPDPPRIIGYEARNSVQVQLRRLGEMGRVIDALVSVGANEINGPNFTLDEPKAAQNEARVEAIATGRQRAELYARAAGMRVVRILSISEGGGHYPVEQIVVTGSRMMAPGAPPPPTPIAPGEVSVGANVSMQFELAR
ncbi:MAG: SIMPL domain-containing protein [Pseudomonadota bacterium]|nr:SIMPL domain-containing protein [Sphingomonas sp.]MDQ3479681.1 SIMPL domain-containing protein [Pseudomonadota bacterium]